MLAGNVISLEGKNPPVLNTVDLEFNPIKRVDLEKENPFIPNEPVLLNAWTSRTIGVVDKAKGKKLNLKMKIPISIDKEEKIAMSRKINGKWRLVGYGIVK